MEIKDKKGNVLHVGDMVIYGGEDWGIISFRNDIICLARENDDEDDDDEPLYAEVWGDEVELA